MAQISPATSELILKKTVIYPIYAPKRPFPLSTHIPNIRMWSENGIFQAR